MSIRIRAGRSKQKAIAQPAQAFLSKNKIEVTFRFIVRVLPRITLPKPPQVALAFSQDGHDTSGPTLLNNFSSFYRLWPDCTEHVVTRNKAVIPEPPQRPAIPVGKLKGVLTHVPDDHCLVPSQIYDFFILDKDGHNKGYISTDGELHWWAAKEE